MNQILSMNQNNPNFGNNYNNMNNWNNGNNGKLDNKVVKRIFGILLIIFGLVMVIVGGMGTINALSAPKGPAINYPIVTPTQSENNILTLEIENNVAIDTIIYAWNDGRKSEISGEGNLKITRDIPIPEGENTLYLTIIDVNGKTTEMSKVFFAEKLDDKTPPDLDVVVNGSKINITAKSVSETKLSYLTYRWNNDEEIRIEATGDQKSIETTIDVLNGTNTLTIEAVNEKGITKTQENEYIGVKKPVIEVKKDDTGEYLLVKITHEQAVKSAEITLNGKNVVLTPDHFGKPEVSTRIKLKEKTNTLKIVATSVNDAVETFNGTATKD